MVSAPSVSKNLNNDYSPSVLQTIGKQQESTRLVHVIREATQLDKLK